VGILRRLTWTRGLAALLVVGLASVFFPRPSYVPTGDVARTLLLLARAATLLLVPGLALVLLLRPFDDLDMLQTIILGLITSLALFPLLLFWVSLAGGEWNAGWARLFLVVVVAVAVWRLWGRARPWPEPARPTVAFAVAVGAEFWLPYSAVGNDGGYWLPYTACRRTILPPTVYSSEAEPVQVAKTNARLHDLIDAHSPEDLGAAMKQAGADYIYVGNRVKQPWQDLLADGPFFEKVYQR